MDSAKELKIMAKQHLKMHEIVLSLLSQHVLLLTYKLSKGDENKNLFYFAITGKAGEKLIHFSQCISFNPFLEISMKVTRFVIEVGHSLLLHKNSRSF